VLGADVTERFGAQLPFLFKVLAAERALSIQAHPRKDQAERGFAREDAAGIPRDAAHRNYRDDNHKPELICALSEFWALRGFRPIREIVNEFKEITGLRTAARVLEGEPTPEGLSRFFRTLMTLSTEERAETVRSAVQLAEREEAGTGEARYRWTRTLFEQYGEDVGVLASLYLNCIHLEPGQGLYLPAQTGGLTSKHIDVPELLSSLEFSDDEPPILQPEATTVPCVSRFATPAVEFELFRVEVGDGDRCALPNAASPRILLCVDGSLSAAAGHAHSLQRGAALFAPANVGEIRMQGRGVAYVAGVGGGTAS
jgi:mannose-6-phosphate isomerase